MVILYFFLLLFGNCVKTENCLPRALEDCDHELLVHTIQTEGRDMVRTRQRTNQDRRVARLYQSGHYRIESVHNPLTENDEEMLVSYYCRSNFSSH